MKVINNYCIYCGKELRNKTSILCKECRSEEEIVTLEENKSKNKKSLKKKTKAK